jgi:SprT protein
MPSVHFNQRGKIAGCARLQKNELRFNPTLLKDNISLFLDEVVPHEVCHIVAFILYGRVRPHGKEWQSLMIDLFGLQPRTYHKMDVTKVQGKQFEYKCECGPIELSIRRHNKVVRGQQKYICRKCRVSLTPLLPK